MKPVRILLCILSFAAFPATGQVHQFIYEFHWIKYDCRPDEAYLGKSILEVSDSLSRFMDLEWLHLAKPEKKGDRVQSTGTKKIFDYVIYKNPDHNRLRFKERIGSTTCYYQEEIPQLSWEIKEDTLSILGYLCQKATCRFAGRDYEAWFSPDIPLSNGPHKFGGLPGLILKLADSQGKIRFTLTGMEMAKTLEPSGYLSGTPVTRKKFKAIEEEYYFNRKNYMGGILNSSMTFTLRGKNVSADELFQDIRNDYLCRVNIDD